MHTTVITVVYFSIYVVVLASVVLRGVRFVDFGVFTILTVFHIVAHVGAKAWDVPQLSAAIGGRGIARGYPNTAQRLLDSNAVALSYCTRAAPEAQCDA